jgi:hypothetical protein
MLVAKKKESDELGRLVDHITKRYGKEIQRYKRGLKARAESEAANSPAQDSRRTQNYLQIKMRCGIKTSLLVLCFLMLFLFFVLV